MSGSRLEGKVAIVTGSTRGIGRAIALRFAEEGAKVVVTGRTDSDGERVAQTIREAGGGAVYVHTDVTKEDDVAQAIASAAEEFGRLDVLVNNAGASPRMPNRRDAAVADLELDVWEGLMRGSATSAFLATKYAIPAMAASGGGAIVSISTGATRRAVPGLAGHTASKTALEALTRSAAVEGAAHGIRANSIIVGYIIDSAGHEKDMADPAFVAAIEQRTLTRLGRTDDIAAAALYLASDEAAFVTGASLLVDGGASVI